MPTIDPRTVPVVETRVVLPAVSTDRLTPGALRQRFLQPPQWQPEVVSELCFSDRLPSRAAVLIAVLQHREPSILLTERTQHLSTHSGQVAFPGGRADAGDADMSATALREAWEEVGLDSGCAEVLGELPVYVTGSSFLVSPVLALVPSSMEFRPNPYEVARVFEVPMAFLMDPRNHRLHVLEDAGQRREWYSMPFRDPCGYEHFIWGATAGMLRNLYRFLIA